MCVNCCILFSLQTLILRVEYWNSYTYHSSTYLVTTKLYSFVSFRFLWPCIVSKVWRERKNQQDATVRCLLLTSVSTCFGHHHAHLQENKGPVTAFGVMFWFCWMWLVAVVGRCVVGCEHIVLASYNAAPHNRYQPHPAEPEHYTKCINRAFVLLKMGMMMA